MRLPFKTVYDAWGNHKTFVLYDSKFVEFRLIYVIIILQI